MERINALKPPSGRPPNPVTKLWPRHLSRALARSKGVAVSLTGAAGCRIGFQNTSLCMGTSERSSERQESTPSSLQ